MTTSHMNTSMFSTSMADNAKSNKAVYNRKKIVKRYIEDQELQPAESAILEKIRKQLPKMAMLDIGVGAGRTTKHFGTIAKSYVGVDIAPNMVEACKVKYPKLRFQTADVRKLPFKEKSFDFILFSFNGIDYVSHKDRLKALGEIKRVAKKGAHFVFSFHNIQCLKKDFGFKPTSLSHAINLGALYFLNPGLMQKMKQPFAIVRGDGDAWSMRTMYTSPVYQREILNKMGMKTTQMFGIQGTKILPKELSKNKDSWIYFHCTL